MALLPVADALRRIAGSVEPVEAQTLPLPQAASRVLAAPVHALRTQPPFPASAMDGYAVRAADAAAPGTRLAVIGQAAAGHPFAGRVGPGQTVRIFTGAPVPEGADAVLIQENARPAGPSAIETAAAIAPGAHVRRAGLDFVKGDLLLEAGRSLDAAALSLAASANHRHLEVRRRPVIAVLATGDELLLPGSEPGPGQIIASNSYGVAALASGAGGAVHDLGIAADTRESLSAALDAAHAARADILVTLGGASVGEHDLVQSVFRDHGMAVDFWKIAMRPGKPLMFGKLGAMSVLGLPGNPVSSLVCAHLFLLPLIAALQGTQHRPDMRQARLETAMPENDDREDYVRARLADHGNGTPTVTPFPVQDSSMLATLAAANALIIRPPNIAAAAPGDMVRVLVLRH